MKFSLKQKLLSFGEDFDVLDENGRKAFYFDSKVGGFTKKIVVLTADGKEVAVIKKKLFTYRPTFTIKKDGVELARVFKKALTFRKTFLVDVPGPNDITVVGRFAEHTYKFLRDGRPIAEVSKKWFTAKDTYGIEVENSNDVLLVLSSAVIIDLICHPGRDSSF
jgi:uncharacterized protein YxjI